MSESNIIQLQKLFDECIYSTLDEEKLRSIAFDSQLVENNLEWDKIYKYFPRKEDFYASLKVDVYKRQAMVLANKARWLVSLVWSLRK